MNTNPYELPKDLPRPADDGAAAHLPGMGLPALVLPWKPHQGILRG